MWTEYCQYPFKVEFLLSADDNDLKLSIIRKLPMDAWLDVWGARCNLFIALREEVSKLRHTITRVPTDHVV